MQLPQFFQKVVSFLGLMMLSRVLSRRVGARVLVQAFNTQSNVVLSRPACRLPAATKAFSSSLGASQIDEDLDAALDGLLGETMGEIIEPKVTEIKEPKIETKQPVPEVLVKTVRGAPRYCVSAYQTPCSHNVFAITGGD